MYEREKKYISIYFVPAAAIVSILAPGWWSFLLPFLTFVAIPTLELFTESSTENLSKEEEKAALEDRFYDYLVYSMVPIQYFVVFYGLYIMKTGEWTTLELIGKTASIGASCGIVGINLGHELGHRTKPHEMFMAKALLLTSLYMHFFIEHNRGHHMRAATKEDPATARRGEILYFFWIRSMVFSFLSAWDLEATRLKKDDKSVISLQNEMVRFILIQLSFLGFIFLVFGLQSMLLFVLAALIGALLLETVNYIEHYGLVRKKKENGQYEKVLPMHSWNSNHALGRLFLFELTRHSDHHYLASRKYQILRHFDESPQMPLGYPGMIVLATIPPVWFFVMHRHIDKYEKNMLGKELSIA